MGIGKPSSTKGTEVLELDEAMLEVDVAWNEPDRDDRGAPYTTVDRREAPTAAKGTKECIMED